jgi:hypothetical protein
VVPAGGDPSLERQLALRAVLAERRCSHFVHRRHHLNRVSHKTDSARPLRLARPLVRQTHQSKVAVRPSELAARAHHRRLARARVRVAALLSEGSRRVTASLASHLLAQGLAKGEAEKSVANLESTNLQPRRPRRRVRVKREAEVKGDKGRSVNLAASQQVVHLPPANAAKDSRSAERKKARGPHRQSHNKICQFS